PPAPIQVSASTSRFYSAPHGAYATAARDSLSWLNSFCRVQTDLPSLRPAGTTHAITGLGHPAPTGESPPLPDASEPEYTRGKYCLYAGVPELLQTGRQ